jgi:DNA primase large subunit
MDARHARYPFLDGARDAVQRADVALVDLVAREREHPAVTRGRERVERALVDGTVDPPEDRRVDARTEVLSYPIARVVVSLLDEPGAVEKYAASEAATARERFVEDVESRSAQTTLGGDADATGVSLEGFVREFELSGTIRPDEERYRLAVAEYLRLAPAGSSWRLVRRELADGLVTVSRGELYDLLRRAVEERVAGGLPLAVPDEIADPLADVVESVSASLSSADYPREFDHVDPSLFPPCVTHLLERARAGEELPDRSRFALVAFLASLGMDGEAITTLCGRSDDQFGYTVERLAGEASDDAGDYPSPSCTTMQAWGDCVDTDDLCAEIDHPLSYYAARLDGADPGAGSDGEEGEGGTAD